MSKSYLLWAVIGMIGYSVTATLVKLATQSGRLSSYFVLMISSAMVVATSTGYSCKRSSDFDGQLRRSRRARSNRRTPQTMKINTATAIIASATRLRVGLVRM